MRIFLLLVLFACIVGCNNSAKPSSTAAEKPKVEANLAFTNLSKKAYAKLDIQTQALKIGEVNERLALTGWIMAKPGHEVTLTAPSAGFVRFRKTAPIPGATISAKQDILDLEPVLTPVEKIQVASLERSVQSDLTKAETTLKVADTEYQRVKGLHTQKLKSDQELEQARKAFDHAVEEKKAAEDKLRYFKTELVPMASPQAGTILQLQVGNGQYVQSSAPLLTIIDLDPVWVRVPVQEFDLPLIDPQASVEVTFKNPNQGRTEGPASFQAKPAGRVAQVDPVKRTAELWYEIVKPGSDARFVKDQMVTVKLALGKKSKAPVVPVGAVIYDAHGRAWVYVETAEKDSKHQFERKPVDVVAGVDGGILVHGPLRDGDRVVSKGAAILFSRDFHNPPVVIAGEDD